MTNKELSVKGKCKKYAYCFSYDDDTNNKVYWWYYDKKCHYVIKETYDNNYDEGDGEFYLKESILLTGRFKLANDIIRFLLSDYEFSKKACEELKEENNKLKEIINAITERKSERRRKEDV